jgi:hypothetical protein
LASRSTLTLMLSRLCVLGKRAAADLLQLAARLTDGHTAPSA